jgi:hypothetical protein
MIPLIIAGISAAASIYGQQKQKAEQEKLMKANQAINNQNLINNRKHNTSF